MKLSNNRLYDAFLQVRNMHSHLQQFDKESY